MDSQATCLPDKFDSESDSGDYRTAVGYDNETNDRANSDVSDSGSYDYYDQTGEDSEDLDCEYTATDQGSDATYWTGLPQLPNSTQASSTDTTTGMTVTATELNAAHVRLDSSKFVSPPTNLSQSSTPQSGEKSCKHNVVGSHNSISTGRMQIFGSPIQKIRTFVTELMNSPVMDGVMSLVSAAKLFSDQSEEPTTVMVTSDVDEDGGAHANGEIDNGAFNPPSTDLQTRIDNIIEEPTTVTVTIDVDAEDGVAHGNGEVDNGPFNPPSTDMQTRIDEIINNTKERDPETLVTELHDIKITYRLFHSLKNGTWLNDEIVNLHMLFLQQRDNALCEANSNRRSSHYFNNFFVNKLADCQGYNYENVKKYRCTIEINLPHTL